MLEEVFYCVFYYAKRIFFFQVLFFHMYYNSVLSSIFVDIFALSTLLN